MDFTMRTALTLAFASLLFTTTVACDTDTSAYDHAAATQQDARANHQFCGGIAGFECPEGMWCQLDGDYPDAGGECRGAPVGGNGNGNAGACELVRCMQVECPEGQRYREPNNGNCCGTCVGPEPAPVDEGYCEVPSDCDGLIHIMCVGSWSCDSNQCVYTCDTSPVEL